MSALAVEALRCEGRRGEKASTCMLKQMNAIDGTGAIEDAPPRIESSTRRRTISRRLYQNAQWHVISDHFRIFAGIDEPVGPVGTQLTKIIF